MVGIIADGFGFSELIAEFRCSVVGFQSPITRMISFTYSENNEMRLRHEQDIIDDNSEE